MAPIRGGSDAARARIGRFEVVAELGRGGLGVVFRARDPALGREVAIKCLHASRVGSPALRRRFAREARVLGRVRHANVVRVHEVGEDDRGQPFIVMDLVPGESLQARLARDGRIPPEEARGIAAKLADALQSAHDQGILHRDVKPDNVLLRADGEPVLTDFGLAGLTAQADDSAASAPAQGALTSEGAFLGTPGFCAPEQAMGKVDAVGPAADVYGLGATLYAMLTGRAPFTAASLPQLLVVQLRTPPALPSTISPEVDGSLDSACARALDADRTRRFATAAELARALRGREVTPTSAGDRVARRRRAGLAAGVLAVVAALVGVGLVAVTAMRAREAADARAASRAAAQEALDALLARLGDGDVGALEDASTVLHDARAAGLADAAGERSRELVAGLAAIREGDDVVLRRVLGSEAPPWSERRALLAEVLIDRGDPGALLLLLERRPEAIVDPDRGPRVAAALAPAPDDAGGARRVLKILEAAPPPADALTARAIAVLRGRLILARHRAALLDARRGLSELEPILQELVDASRAFHGRLDAEPAIVARLIDLAADIEMSAEQPEDIVLCEAITAVLDPDDIATSWPLAKTMWFQVVTRLLATEGRGQLLAPGIGPRMYELSVELHRIGAWAHELEMTPRYLRFDAEPERTTAWLTAREEELAVVPIDELIPADAASLLVTRVWHDAVDGADWLDATARQIPTRHDREAPEVARGFARHEVLVGRLLERERVHHDVPGWALGWLARRAGQALIALELATPGAEPARLEEARDTVARALGVPPASLAARVSELHALAVERDRARPRMQRVMRPLAHRAEWLLRGPGARAPGVEDEVLELVLEGFDLTEDKRAEQLAFDWNGDPNRMPMALAVHVDVARDLGWRLALRARDERTIETIERLADGASATVPQATAGAELKALGHLLRGEDAEALEVLEDHVAYMSSVVGRSEPLPPVALVRGLGAVRPQEVRRASTRWRAERVELLRRGGR